MRSWEVEKGLKSAFDKLRRVKVGMWNAEKRRRESEKKKREK